MWLPYRQNYIIGGHTVIQSYSHTVIQCASKRSVMFGWDFGNYRFCIELYTVTLELVLRGE